MLIAICSAFLLTLLGIGIWRVARDPKAASDFEKNYANIVVRLAESGIVAAQAFLRVLGSRAGKDEIYRGFSALAVFAGCAALPILALLIADSSTFEHTSVAFGIGALLWTIILELGNSKDRLESIFQSQLPCLSFPWVVILMALANGTVIGIAVAMKGHTQLDAALTGAALTAIADLVSASLALWWSAFSNPLTHPSPNTKTNVP